MIGIENKEREEEREKEEKEKRIQRNRMIWKENKEREKLWLNIRE